MTAETQIKTYLEIGKKKIFAGAVEWPGWCRSGKTEEAALAALCGHSLRYEKVLEKTALDFWAPNDVDVFNIIERLEGNSTTDFGAPGMPLAWDARPTGEAELERFRPLLTASWQALDAAVKSAEGKSLRKGPRGGGRELDKIVRHVLEAERAYLARLDWNTGPVSQDSLAGEAERLREESLLGLESAAAGEIPPKDPRGGRRWMPRYYVRRSAWHVLDHAWEIEDRIDTVKG